MTLSTPVKVFALAALGLVLGLGGIALVLGGGSQSAPTPAVSVPAPVHHPAAALAEHKVAPPKRHATPVKLDSNLPLVVRHALEHHAVVVVAIYSSRVASDRALLAAARKGAYAAHAGFVTADVAREPIAFGVAGWSDSLQVPAVLVARRPGTVVFAASGATDTQTVAEAAASAK